MAARGGSVYSVFFPAALAFAHLARAAAASLALTAGLLRLSFFLAALTFAHLALVPAIIAALPAALNRRLPFLAGLESASPLIFAQRALAAAAILARTAADLRRRLLVAIIGIGESLSAVMESIRPCSFSIRSLMAMILLSWLVVKSVKLIVIGHW